MLLSQPTSETSSKGAPIKHCNTLKVPTISRRSFCTQLSSSLALTAFASTPLVAASSSSYKNRLYTPTQITKIFGTYFIVDCWHHRILWSNNIRLPLSEWQVLDDNLAGPHSIASNGSIYVAEDTGRHAIKVFRQSSHDKFSPIQTVPNIGKRPHRVLYDSRNEQFIIVGSADQSIHICVEKEGKLSVVYQREIVELQKQYCRSITIKDDSLYFVGSKDILIFELRTKSVGKLKERFKLDHRYTGSNDLFFVTNSAGFLTSSPGRLVSFESLSDLQRGTAVDFSKPFKGTPYYIERFDNKIWIPEITEHSAINFKNNLDLKSMKIEKLLDYGPPNQASIDRKLSLPV